MGSIFGGLRFKSPSSSLGFNLLLFKLTFLRLEKAMLQLIPCVHMKV